MKKVDLKFLESLSHDELKRIKWFSMHVPSPRAKNQIPQDKKSQGLWESLPYSKGKKKIFPRYKDYVWSCRKFGTMPVPKYKKGTPKDILNEIKLESITKNYIIIYDTLFQLSYYNKEWKMRVCEISIGLLIKKTKLSKRTIQYALKYLRGKWFVRTIWRGYQKPQDLRYKHSCYELPFNYAHVLSWRINKGRKKNRKN